MAWVGAIHLMQWKNQKATPVPVLMMTGFKEMCDTRLRKAYETSFVVETKDHILCLAGDPRYKFDVKAIVHREDLK